MFEVDFHILNQKATPAIYADTLALRPAFGFAGRLFVATDSPYGVFRDTGTAWVQVASNGGGGGSSTGVNGLNGTTNIGLGGTLNNNTIINGNNKDLSFGDDLDYLSLFKTRSTSFDLQTLFNSGIGGSIFSSNNTALRLFYQEGIGGSNNEINLNGKVIKTFFNNVEFGLNLDDTTGKFVLGDYSNGRKYNAFVVNDDTNEFYINTSYNQVNNNEKDLFYAYNGSAGSRFVKLGDFQSFANNYSLIVDDANAQLYTTTTNGYNGLFITDTECFFGQSNPNFYCGFRIEQDQRITSKIGGNITEGLSLDFLNARYTIGGIVFNNNLIEIDDGSNNITFKSGNLSFTGATLEDLTPGITATKALLITLNGTQYKINLY